MNIRRRQGFSLLEVLVSIAILALVLSMVYMTLFRTTSEYEVNSRRSWIIDSARLALDEMTEDIRQGNVLSLTPIPATPPPGTESSPPSTQVSFFKVKAPIAGVAQYTANPITYLWEASTATGGPRVDANNNGIVDEGRLVRVDENGKRRIMCSYVKNAPDGLQLTQAFSVVDGVRKVQIRIRLNLLFTDSNNKVLEQALETKVFMRNSQ